MLVLSRKKNESIVINNDIIITVVEIRGDKVRLGIIAPKDVPVHRQEIFDAIHGKEEAPETLMAEDIDIPTNDAIGGEVPKNIRLTEVESWAIKIALERNGWNQTQAAKVLGIHRETLLDKMKKYKIAKSNPKTS